MHDSYVPLDPPNRKAIPVEKPEDVIGTPYIPCEDVYKRQVQYNNSLYSIE